MKTVDVKVKTDEKMQSGSPARASNMPVVLSALVLAIVVGFSVYLKVDTLNLHTKTENANKSISDYEMQIGNLRNDPKILASEVLSANKADIEKTIAASQAQRYVSELMNLSKKYDILFSGFAFTNGKIATSAVATSATPDDAVTKISKMIADYRSESLSGVIFTLAPVTGVSGQEQRRAFNLEFDVK